MQDEPMSILQHLEALRRALIVSIVAIIPGAAIGWFIRQEILAVLIKPVIDMNYKLVYIGATEALTAEITLAVFAGIVLALPVIAYQFWKFILPALHAHEKRYIVIFVPVSLVLFICGLIFGYYTVFTYGVKFLLGFGINGITPMLSLGRYLSFTMWFLLPFGIMFEMPLVVLLLVRMGLISRSFLAAKRKIVFVAAFVIAAVVTPTTDMFSQSVMAVAIYLLYEASIWISFFFRPAKKPKPIVATADIAISSEPVLVDEDTGIVNRDEDTSDYSGQDNVTGNNKLEDVYRNIVERGNNDDKK